MAVIRNIMKALLKLFTGTLAIAWISCFVCLGSAYCAEGLSPSELVIILKGNDLAKQSDALDIMVHNGGRVKEIYKTREIKEALYDLLVKIAKPTDSFYKTEIPAAPLPIQIMAVLGDFGETRAIPYLLNNLTNGWGIVLSLALMEPPVIKPMLAKMQNGDSRERAVACDYFKVLFSTKTPTLVRRDKTIVNPYAGIYTPQGEEREEIRTALKQALKDDKMRRTLNCSITVLRLIGNPEDNSLLEEADKKNPYRMTPEKREKMKERMRLYREESQRKREERRRQGLPEQEPIEGD